MASLVLTEGCGFCSVPAQKLNESGDPPVLRAQISQVFDEWIRLSDEYPRDEAHDSFVARLQQLGFLKVGPGSTAARDVLLTWW